MHGHFSTATQCLVLNVSKVETQKHCSCLSLTREMRYTVLIVTILATTKVLFYGVGVALSQACVQPKET